MRELNQEEISIVSGAGGSDGINWNQTATGVGAIAISIGVAATPVGWVGALGAGAFALAGGYAVGSGLVEGS